MRLFHPVLAGAPARDRALACVGALFGIGATGLISRAVLGEDTQLAMLLAAPLGASAVLLFAVPETFGEPLDISRADLRVIANLAAAEARTRSGKPDRP